MAVGLIITFRASNVLNFANAAMGMYVAYVYYGLRDFDLAGRDRGGDLVLPIIGLPTQVHVVDRPTMITALARHSTLAPNARLRAGPRSAADSGVMNMNWMTRR